MDWTSLANFRHIVDEQPDYCGCDVVWFTVESKGESDVLTLHRCQVKLGESQVPPSTVEKWARLLVGLEAKKGYPPFDEKARASFEEMLQKKNKRAEVEVKTYIVTTRRIHNVSACSKICAEMAQKVSGRFSCELWDHAKCVSDLWPAEISDWAKAQGLKSYFV